MINGVSQYRLAKQLPVTQGALSKLLKRTMDRSEASGLPLWDAHLYETDLGRGAPSAGFSEAQKKAIIAVATRDFGAREKQSWKAIADGDFDHLDLPKKLSITSFENIMYEAGYARRKPGWNLGMVLGKYRPPSGACPVMVACRKSTGGDWWRRL